MPLSDALRSRSAMFFIAAFVIGQAVQINNGNLHPVSLCAIAAALVILGLAVCGPERFVKTENVNGVRRVVGVLIAVQWIELLLWGLESLPVSSSIGWFVAAMVVAGVGTVLMFVSNASPAASLSLLVCGQLLAGSYVIRAVPQPGEDLWYFEQASTAALLHGENPYSVRYRNPYDPDTSFFGPGAVENGWMTSSYPYPPLMAILSSAGRAFGDVRWAMLAALALSAVLMARAGAEHRGDWSAAMLLTMPFSLRIIAGGWSEPMVILMLTATLYCALRARRRLWLVVGLLLAIKQYTMLIAPLTLLLMDEGATRKDFARMMAKACGVAIAITLPFALWDFSSFYRSVVIFQLRQPFRVDSLSFNAMLKVISGIEIGAAPGFLFASAVTIWALRRAPRTPMNSAGASSLLLLAFFAFNKQAFGNYYLLVFATTSFAAAMTPTRRQDAAQQPPETSYNRMAA